jgi:hypothetical protein
MCDYRVFDNLNKVLKGHRSGLDRHQAVTVKWFEQQPREFSAEGIHWLVCHGMTALMPYQISFHQPLYE